VLPAAAARALAAPLDLSRAATRIAAVGAQAVLARRQAREARPLPADVDARAARAYALHRLCGRLCRAQGIRVIPSGALPSGPVILVSNHQSYLDPIVLGALTPCAPIAKREIRGWPVMGEIMESMGTIFVDRASAASGAAVLATAQETLSRGVPVLCFPEGTTTDGTKLLPFRRGIFGVALATGVPVVPIAIEYDGPDIAWYGDMLFAPHYLKLAARREVLARIRIAPALRASDFDDAASLTDAARAEIERNLPGKIT
ncbi:MAG TPA: lysophospholipid acyltransferase family protein, partial [bacterium]|nr:lysophospholipid acyltransferase family protein [bacterium]